MVNSTFYNRVMFQAVAGGTGDFIVNTAISGYSTPAQRGVTDGATVSYTAESLDKTQWETGTGVYTAASTTVARTNIRESSNANLIVNFSASPIVFLDYQAQDIKTVPPYVYISDFGVMADNFTDDTAALNAAFASLAGSRGTVVFDKAGFCKVTGTIVVGQLSGSGATSFINIECPYGQATSGIRWHGGPTGTVVAFAKNKYSRINGLGVTTNQARDSVIGIALGGDSSGFGTQTLSLTFESCLVDGFDIGIVAGANSGAASEITFIGQQINSCNTGFTITDFNSLDFVFVMLSLSGNDVGLATGAASGFAVYGGSASFSTIADFLIEANSNLAVIRDFRTEVSGALVKGGTSAGQVEINNCYSVQAAGPNFYDIYGSFSRLTIKNCHLNGYVYLTTNPNFVTMENNALERWDTTRQLPLVMFLGIGNQSINTQAVFINNVDVVNFPGTPIPDLQGNIGTRVYDTFTGDNRPFYEPSISVIPIDNTSTTTIGTATLALSHVKHLAEGTLPGATAGTPPVPGKNLRVSGVFATAASLAFTFQRSLTVTGISDPLVTATAGTFLPTDVGKRLKITAGADTGVDWYGYITEYLTPTTVNVFPNPTTTGRYPQGAGKAAVVGEDEPDANYFVAGICGDANETFWVTGIGTTGFTMNSSNATSTATVIALIVR